MLVNFPVLYFLSMILFGLLGTVQRTIASILLRTQIKRFGSLLDEEGSFGLQRWTTILWRLTGFTRMNPAGVVIGYQLIDIQSVW